MFLDDTKRYGISDVHGDIGERQYRETASHKK